MATQSLFNICLDAFALNIDLLDSLIGFPETIGNIIFQHVVGKGCFADIRRKRFQILKVFSAAYKECGFLKSISLQGCHLFLNDILDEPHWEWMFESLIQLDLSGCGLGDSHEMITELAKLNSLQTLILANNSLSDDGVRRLTARLRMFKESKSTVKYLNLAYNKAITIRSLAYLQAFEALAAVRLSNTSVSQKVLTCNATTTNKWSVAHCDCVQSSFDVHTEGWAANVIKEWLAQYSEGKRNQDTKGKRPSSSQSSSVHRFYSRRKCPEFITSEPHNNEQISNDLVLVSSNFVCSHIKTSASQNSLKCQKKQRGQHPPGQENASKFDNRKLCSSGDPELSTTSKSFSWNAESDVQFSCLPKLKKQKTCENSVTVKRSISGPLEASQKCSENLEPTVYLESRTNSVSSQSAPKPFNQSQTNSSWLLSQYMESDAVSKESLKKTSLLDRLAEHSS